MITGLLHPLNQVQVLFVVVVVVLVFDSAPGLEVMQDAPLGKRLNIGGCYSLPVCHLYGVGGIALSALDICRASARRDTRR